ncbi:hypothetical protein KUTeg_002831 [Tegillarca granosa]|uniref:Uncharacterized protein n=1 Tax=Tegillarca granosa TaxID=220873 RepID=A0ABQ9FQR5_TEGGR|nr:hypothetical protein KUTeg_011182 [Tegillarca granosa]KAJ8319614.1 hypothetical protein KUTeg_002831 [Tegillarca granosa]
MYSLIKNLVFCLTFISFNSKIITIINFTFCVYFRNDESSRSRKVHRFLFYNCMLNR